MMNRTKILTLLLTLSSGLLTTSCQFAQEDFFDEGAAQRIIHFNEDLQKRLVEQSSGTNEGWIIQYFVADALIEGFNLFGRFEASGKVTLASDHRYLRNGQAGQYTESASTYEMLAEEGPVLSFNTWNDVLTVFEDPVSPSSAPGQLVNDGAGMYGDHNLVFVGYKGNNILFRGERSEAEVRLVPCDRPWQTYITDVANLKARITNTAITDYYLIVGTDTMYYSNLRSGVILRVDRLDDPLDEQVLSCLFTDKGFLLNTADNLSDHSFQEFTLTDDESQLVSEDGAAQVVPMWDTYIHKHTAVWTLNKESFTDEQQALAARIDAALTVSNPQRSLASIGLGKSSGGNAVLGLVVTFYTDYAKTKTNTIGLALKYTRTALGEVTISALGDTTKDMDKNMQNLSARSADLEGAVRDFSATLFGTYTMTPDDYFLPTQAVYTSLTDGSRFEAKK